MMADDQEQPKTRMGFLPKLVLWSLVLLFGFLYLGSLERDQKGATPVATSGGGGESAPPTAATAGAPEVPAQPQAQTTAAAQAPTTPVRPAAETVEATTKTAAATLAAPAASPEPSADGPESSAGEVSQEEAEAFAQALMTKVAGSGPRSAEQAATAEEDAQPAPSTVVPDASAESAEVADAPSAVAEAADLASATKDPSAIPESVAPAPVAPARGGDWVARHRAEIEAYYAERRRQAEAFARERWQAMRSLYPAGPPIMPTPSPLLSPYGRWPAPPAPRYPSAPSGGAAE
jgi:hypothetical protein